MDRREAMALSGSGSYYIQRGIPGSGPPPPQTQPTFHGSQGFHHFSNSNSPFGSNPNPNPGGGSTGFVSPPLQVESSPADSSATVGAAVAPPPSGDTSVKRKRGRPRKYGQDGSVSLALSPSVSNVSPNSSKRGRGRPPGSGRKHRQSSIGDMMPSSSGMSFTPHVIVVSVGEDIASKVISFSHQGPRAICVLSASGAVSTATLLQPPPSHGTITYEGRFELISLSTSYLNTTDNDYPNRTGSLAVSLASPDGRVIGGGIGGPLIAASSVQVIVGSFIWATPKGKIKKREETSEDVQDTGALVNNDNTAATSPPVPQQSQNLVQSPVGIWSTGSRSMDMHHAHIDIDLMRG
ncbi:PREDICTED: AT-hook motif nuclear-localized protein 11 [Camelina sativa]|uniref:AT-hook motif nuclear-localized protein n=1 Tax=Camelina sativa TaxID=90675 RepID=A0ABM0SMJ9_CAMSA|nr:PREDICTED: AT-hook motif nuclear-localized protein 11 [Camelina sativa]XP_010413430.1 PREDICTED: AT-hook motif nuclear-localized protein 11 [Camelina sativa]XP_010413431.1 PREDICTED: AT-hook motif nuclear-localized protein 11 [Camelina sativa]XP_010413433.1 PREDICTED: AT-hook motif nuclear-localized protein 11 [Camelina sativa]